MGKKSSKTKSTSTSTPWAPAQPHLLGAANTITDTVNANQGNLNSIAGGIRGQLPGLAQQAFGQQPGIQHGMGYIADSLNGKYLNSNPANAQLARIGGGSMLNANPYTAAMAQQAGQDALNGVNSSFSMAGRTGGGNNLERAGQGIAQAENQVMFGNYQPERALQQQALGQQSQNYNTGLQAQSSALNAIPGMVSSQYAGIPSYLGAAQAAATLPYAGVQNLGQIGGLFGGYGTSTGSGTQPGGWGQQLLGAAASAAPFLSDRRLKTNIEKVGELADGLGIYDFDYRQDNDLGLPTNRFRGVMADEVEILRPQAFIPNFIGGFAGVDYGAL